MSEKYITYNIDNNIECYYTYKGYTLENLIKDLNIDNYYILKQIHSNKVFDITNIPKNYEGDGLITNKSNIALVTKSKDCNSIFIIDTKNKIIGNIHSGWQGTIKKIAKRAGITKKISAHSLRRTAATNMYRAGFQVKEIQNVLGHQSLGTTDIYLKGLEDCANNVFQNFVIKGE